MNNLVSTDLGNLVDGWDFLLLGLSSSPLRARALSSILMKIYSLVLYFPLQVVMCVWFLYNILGWSAFVGLVVMVTLFPIPGIVAGKIQNVQKEAMRRVSVLPNQYLDFTVYFAVRRMSVCRLLPKVRS